MVAAGLAAALPMPGHSAAQTFALDSTKGLQPRGVTVEAATYLGRKAGCGSGWELKATSPICI